MAIDDNNRFQNALHFSNTHRTHPFFPSSPFLPLLITQEGTPVRPQAKHLFDAERREGDRGKERGSASMLAALLTVKADLDRFSRCIFR